MYHEKKNVAERVAKKKSRVNNAVNNNTENSGRKKLNYKIKSWTKINY